MFHSITDGFPPYETLIAHHPTAIKKRLNALRNLQDEHATLEAQFKSDLLELEKKYAKFYAPIYLQRSEIITGTVEPTAEQTKYKDETVQDSTSEDAKEDVKGIPRFWLQVLKNHPSVAELITEKDEEALEHLTDIKYEFLSDNPGFKLEFYFSPNKFFTNTVLTKTYYLTPSPDLAYGDVIYEKAEGTKIEWKETMDLSVAVELKKQRHKATNKVRTIKKEIQTDTFFNFFNPPKASESEEDPEVDDMLESDYEIGELIKEKMIPKAVDWFTGKALEYEESLIDDEFFDGLESGDDDDDNDDDDDDDDDADAGRAGEKPECKQQ